MPFFISVNSQVGPLIVKHNSAINGSDAENKRVRIILDALTYIEFGTIWSLFLGTTLPHFGDILLACYHHFSVI